MARRASGSAGIRSSIYNLLLLSGFVLSGVTIFLLVRALTGRRDAAIVAGAIFALYPYRFEHYSHLELQMTMWMPLALLELHRTIAQGQIARRSPDRARVRPADALVALLRVLSERVHGRARGACSGPDARGRPLFTLAARGPRRGALVAPVAAQYLANKPMMGERDRHGPVLQRGRIRLPPAAFAELDLSQLERQRTIRATALSSASPRSSCRRSRSGRRCRSRASDTRRRSWSPLTDHSA